MPRLPWDLIQIFYTLAKFGSLSKAARELGTSQPTLSRQLARLEQQMTVTLFDRSTQGLKITEAGQRLLESSQLMNQASEQFNRIASGDSLSLTGSIRITANEVLGLYYLPSIIAQFNRLYPEIQVEINISNQATSLHKRDADIALRMFRPSQPDLIARRLKDIQLNAVASSEYFKKFPVPKTLKSLEQHKLIGFDRDIVFVNALKALQWPLADKNFIFKTDFLPLQIELARQGAGITITHSYLLQRWPELQIILPDLKIPSLEFWLVCHADVQHNRKIRLMMDFLAQQLNDMLEL
ncbi:LysR family transcriptional regulator [Thalassotalea insulae]|uniref:LysR family transcriptional regulator n=1 Tax=Thalassotalea insulae TaxID=2056778 RepID=A0ABQ6GSW3_9GAMM|nr:LysR family transcriptional regulator [Thalassotalea insulae]GLX78249.1 LysR family transcriptional regulator [Thalassotalea insulae]